MLIMPIETSSKTEQISLVLQSWLKERLSIETLAWLNLKLVEISQTNKTTTLFSSFSAVPRYLGKEKLNLLEDELKTAQNLVVGWQPSEWSIDQVGRTLLLLAFPSQDSNKYVATLNQILASADVGETIAFYQSLPLLPHPEKFQLRAAEGVRTNMTSVFNAVALKNPYPAKYLNELAWNQMVLKALFVGSPLHPIYGLEHRNNQLLCQMLVDYASERLAASRTVSSELWELVMVFDPGAVARLKPDFQAVCR